MLIVLHILLDGVGKYLAVRSVWLQKRNFCHHTEFVLVNAYIYLDLDHKFLGSAKVLQNDLLLANKTLVILLLHVTIQN